FPASVACPPCGAASHARMPARSRLRPCRCRSPSAARSRESDRSCRPWCGNSDCQTRPRPRARRRARSTSARRRWPRSTRRRSVEKTFSSAHAKTEMAAAFMPPPPRQVPPAARLHTRKCAELRRLRSPAYACPLPASAGKRSPLLCNNPWEAKMTSMRLWHLGGALIAAAWVAPAAFAQAPAPAAPTAANPWFQGAPFPEASEEVLGATAAGKVYVFAGLAPGWKPKAMVYEYDPASNQWAKKRPMRLPSHHVPFAPLNNKIYAFGGFTYPDSGPPGWNAVNNAWEYDPATDEWKELAPMPTKRGAASAGVANGKIYVTGGANSLPGVNENGIHP